MYYINLNEDLEIFLESSINPYVCLHTCVFLVPKKSLQKQVLIIPDMSARLVLLVPRGTHSKLFPLWETSNKLSIRSYKLRIMLRNMVFNKVTVKVKVKVTVIHELL